MGGGLQDYGPFISRPWSLPVPKLWKLFTHVDLRFEAPSHDFSCITEVAPATQAGETGSVLGSMLGSIFSDPFFEKLCKLDSCRAPNGDGDLQAGKREAQRSQVLCQMLNVSSANASQEQSLGF